MKVCALLACTECDKIFLGFSIALYSYQKLLWLLCLFMKKDLSSCFCRQNHDVDKPAFAMKIYFRKNEFVSYVRFVLCLKFLFTKQFWAGNRLYCR